MGTGLEAPTWAPVTRADAQTVLEAYPQAGGLEAIDWHSPRPFSAGALLRCTKGWFFLKRHNRALRSRSALAEEHGLIAHLRAQGAPVADIVETIDGQTTLEVGEWVCELHRRVPGIDLYRDRPSWTPYLSARHAQAAGAALARLHDAAHAYAGPPRNAGRLITSLTILPAADPLDAARAYIDARPALAAFLAAQDTGDTGWEASLKAVFERWWTGDEAIRLAAEPKLWTHNDWHPSNLSWDEAGEVASVFDFGLADRTCALHDLATALERTAVAWLRLGDDKQDGLVDFAGAEALLAGYHAVRPLSRADRTLIAALLPVVHVEFALSEADYFIGVLNDEAGAMLAWKGYLLGHAQWFETRQGRALLEIIAKEGAVK